MFKQNVVIQESTNDKVFNNFVLLTNFFKICGEGKNYGKILKQQFKSQKLKEVGINFGGIQQTFLDFELYFK